MVGGLMVQLHAFERQSTSRLTEDIDVLGDSRPRPSMTQYIAELLQRGGAKMKMPSRQTATWVTNSKSTARSLSPWTRWGESQAQTVDGYTTFEVPGGTQALNRSEIVMVSVDGDAPVAVRRPSLLGAVLIKARPVAWRHRAS